MRKVFAVLIVALVFGATLAQQPETPPEPQDPNSQPPAQTPPEEPQEQAQPEPSAPPPPEPQAAAPAPVPVTLGEFVMKMAIGLKLQPPAAGFTPESAAWGLVRKGIKVSPELMSPLSEADAVSVLTELEYEIRTSTPSRVMTSDRVGLLIETFIPPDKS